MKPLLSTYNFPLPSSSHFNISTLHQTMRSFPDQNKNGESIRPPRLVQENPTALSGYHQFFNLFIAFSVGNNHLVKAIGQFICFQLNRSAVA